MPSRADASLSRRTRSRPADAGPDEAADGERGRTSAGRPRFLVALLPPLLLFLLGCTGHRAPAAPSAGFAIAPWEIPREVLGTQRLYRVSYSGPEGEGSFRVTLRFAAPERYQLQAVDPLGRALFTLDVADGAGLLLNHRSRSFCRFQGSFETEDLPLGPFPLVALPTLLLDRLPVAPPAPLAPGSSLEFVDADGRGWSVAVDGRGAPTSWSLREGGAPSVWWVRRDGWSLLSDRKRGVQIRWREVVEEPLPRAIAPPEVPAGYRERACAAPDLPGAPEPGREEPRPEPGAASGAARN